MKKLIIVTHPNLKNAVINKQWINELEKHKDTFHIHALYTVYPDLNFDIEAEQEILAKHDEIIFQFPLHWFNVPFALKKYLDNILSFGWAFGPGGDKLNGKKIGFAVSSGGDKASYERHITLEQLLLPMYTSFQFCGCKLLPTHKFYGANHQPKTEDILKNAKEYIALFAEEHKGID